MSIGQGLQADLPWGPGGADASGPARLRAWAPADWPVAEGWAGVTGAFFASPTGQRLGAFVQQRLDAGASVYPPAPLRALAATPLAAVRLVVLGQDPYHGPGQAEGLAFSVAPGQALPPSLRNIFQELQRDLGLPRPASGSLADWAGRGVLLLNTCLTVEDGAPASHARQGWEALTDALIAAVAAQASPCAYLLWGAHAQAKAGLITETAARAGCAALVLQANHPSPLSARRPPVPFLGCGHFSQARDWLAARGVALDLALPAAP